MTYVEDVAEVVLKVILGGQKVGWDLSCILKIFFVLF